MQTDPCKFSSRTFRLVVSKQIKLGLTALYKALYKNVVRNLGEEHWSPGEYRWSLSRVLELKT